MISRKFYIDNKKRYTDKEEAELIEFCKKDLAKGRRYFNEWDKAELDKQFESLNRRVLMLYKLRRGGV